MSSAFDAYPALLHCGICRDDIEGLPVGLTPVERALQQLTPPVEFLAAHSSAHLVSFARHVCNIVEDPIRRVEVGSQRYAAVLGVAVFHFEPDGTFSTALWRQPESEGENWLVEFYPRDTPILDFPRTALWHSTLREAFVREAQGRIGCEEIAEGWADWAWNRIRERVIDPIDLRRLRARIRGGLALDWATVSMMLDAYRFDGARFPCSVITYNATRRDFGLLRDLQRYSALFPLLARRFTLPEVGAGGSAEAAARFKQACLSIGLRRAQWRLVAERSAPLLPLWQSFIREFMGDMHREPAADFLRVIALLEPTGPIDLEVWRAILSMTGTCVNAPPSYADSLVRVGDTLRHIVRLIATGRAPSCSGQRRAELHEICAWVADKAVNGLSRAQRARGWAYLLRRAKLHADERRRMLELESMQWPVPLHPVSVGELTAVPLTCGMDLWEESVAMHHCADLYGERCAAGTTLVLSVRTADGGRKATLAIERRRGDWVLSHAVGPFNRQIGKEFDDLIDATLSLLNAVDSSRRRSLRGPRYRIDVVDNFDHGESWSENTFRSVEAALGEARRICRSGLPSRDESGREAWLLFGETPIIVELDGAEPANFDALEYINRLCKVSRHS